MLKNLLVAGLAIASFSSAAEFSAGLGYNQEGFQLSEKGDLYPILELNYIKPVTKKLMIISSARLYENTESNFCPENIGSSCALLYVRANYSLDNKTSIVIQKTGTDLSALVLHKF